jgi:hypothetical protein
MRSSRERVGLACRWVDTMSDPCGLHCCTNRGRRPAKQPLVRRAPPGSGRGRRRLDPLDGFPRRLAQVGFRVHVVLNAS